MTLKITLTIDQENEQATVLIGLLAKALGRGEAGVSDLRIEPALEPAIPRPHSKIQKMVEAAAAQISAPRKRRIARIAPGLGSRPSRKGKRDSGVRLTLRALKHEASLDGLKEIWAANGLARNGVGATLSKMAVRGLVKRVGEGVWRLTPTGAELEASIEKRNDNQNG